MQTKTREKENVQTVPISTRITGSMQKGIERILATDGHLNTADYVRDLIRKDLEKRGLLTEPIPT